MDIGTINTWLTVIVFVVFIGIVKWAYSGRRKADFDAAARIPLDDDDDTQHVASLSGSKTHG